MDDNQIFFVCLIVVILLVGFIISECHKNKNNENFSMQLPLPQNQYRDNLINQYNVKKQNNNQNINPVNQNNVNEAHPYKLFPKEKKIMKCHTEHNKHYRHSKKQKAGPVEYTNTKTHIGPSNNFHQCFHNGSQNINSDLGWRGLEFDYKKNNQKYIDSLNPNNNLNNPAGANYLASLQNLENVYL